MNDNFNEQKDKLDSIKKEIKLLYQQVDYLIRNEKPLELLDLDVMMNRTHTIYDLMCGIDAGEVESEELKVKSGEVNEEELPVGVEEIRSLFGLGGSESGELKVKSEEMEEEQEGLDTEFEEAVEEEQVPVVEEEATEAEEEVPAAEEDVPEVDEDAYFIEEAEEEEEVSEELKVKSEELKVESEEENKADDFGFILNFEPAEEESEELKVESEELRVENEEENKEVYNTGDEIEMTIPHQETENGDIHEEETLFDPVVIGDMENTDDGGFELEQPETLGERYQQNQVETLSEKLQHSSVNDLQKAIGINDKFLFVNELFNGSMEKYSRSIENLNDLKTLNGALIYLNELRVELQWNSNNEAYKKLLELVHRKFEA